MTGKYFKDNDSPFDNILDANDDLVWNNIINTIASEPGYEYVRSILARNQNKPEAVSRYYPFESLSNVMQSQQQNQQPQQPQIHQQPQPNMSIGANPLITPLPDTDNDNDNDGIMRTSSIPSQYEDEQFIDDEDDESDLNRQILDDNDNFDSQKTVSESEFEENETEQDRIRRLQKKKRENEQYELEQEQQHMETDIFDDNTDLPGIPQHIQANPSIQQPQQPQQHQRHHIMHDEYKTNPSAIHQPSQTHPGIQSIQSQIMYPYAATPNPYAYAHDQENINPNTNTTSSTHQQPQQISNTSNINILSQQNDNGNDDDNGNDINMVNYQHPTTPQPSPHPMPTQDTHEYAHSDFEANSMQVDNNASSSGSDHGDNLFLHSFGDTSMVQFGQMQSQSRRNQRQPRVDLTDWTNITGFGQNTNQ